MTRLREEARRAVAMNSPAQSPSVQARSRRRLNVATPATQARQVVENPHPTELRSPNQSTNPLGLRAEITPTQVGAATVNLVPVLGDAPPILSQEESSRGHSCGQGRGRGGHLRRPTRGRRQNPTPSPPGHRGGRHGAHPDTPNGGGADTAVVVDARRGRGRGSLAGRGATRNQAQGRGAPGGRRGGRATPRGGGRGTAPAEGTPAPLGWTPPTIHTHPWRSPIRLRAREQELRAEAVIHPETETTVGDVDSDSVEGGFLTPGHTPPWPGAQASPVPPICRFTVVDFQPGAPPTDTASRQSLGEHHPSRHYCGVLDCPFALSSPASIARASSQGVPLQRTGTPTDHARVDHRAFPAPVYVQVRLSLLGFDHTLWGDLEHFTGQVEHRYYHEVTGQPMFSVNFGGSIGVRELRVSDTEPVSAVRRTLHFDVGKGSGTTTRVHSGLMAQGARIPQESQDDSDTSDVEWVGDYHDFEGDSFSGIASPHLADELCHEDAMRELGHYDVMEDVSQWTFGDRFADAQWNEPNLTLLGSRDNFTGPIPGPATVHSGLPLQAEEYFLRFWPGNVL
jgi:hypothetical protein